jgi:hypothetical protein
MDQDKLRQLLAQAINRREESAYGEPIPLNREAIMVQAESQKLGTMLEDIAKAMIAMKEQIHKNWVRDIERALPELELAEKHWSIDAEKMTIRIAKEATKKDPSALLTGLAKSIQSNEGGEMTVGLAAVGPDGQLEVLGESKVSSERSKKGPVKH